MLQVLREQASSWVVKILLGLLIVAFAIWGINDVFLGERDPAVAKVGGVKIPRSEAESAFRDEINRLRPAIGNLDYEAAFRMGMHKEILNRLVNRTAINLCIRDLGLDVTDEMVNRHIRMSREFQDPQGRFDRSRFFRALATANVSEAYYVSSLKERLATDQVSGAISSNIPVPSVLLGPVTSFRSEERKAETLLVPVGPLGALRNPKEAELEAYYKANKNRFMAPEFRDVTFVHLDPDVLAKEINISDEELKKLYDERIAEFTRPERRKISQVVFKTENAAAQVVAAVTGGKGLADAAKETDKSLKVVNLGWVQRKDLFSELAQPVFTLEKGAVSKPLKSSLGWHVVSVEDSESRLVKPFAEVKKTLHKDIARRRGADVALKLTADLEDSLAAGASIEAAAQKVNLKAIRLTIDNGGRGQDGKAVKSLPPGRGFLQAVAQTQEGETSPLGETQEGGFFILVLNKIIAPALKPLQEVRDLAAISWKAEEQFKAVEKRAEGILARLKKGEKLETIATAEKLVVKKSAAFTRLTHEAESGVPAALAEKLFAIKKGEAAMAEAEKGYVVGVVTSVNPAQGANKSDIQKAALDEIRNGLASDIFEQLIAACRSRVTIKTYPELLRNRT